MVNMKECIHCGLSKPLDEFYKDARRTDGYGIYCKLCWKVKYQTSDKQREAGRKAARDFHHKNKNETWYKELRRWAQIKQLYGLSRDDYQALLEKQDFACALCRTVFDFVVPVVDHDHSCCSGNKSCGKCIRGLLCGNCNRGLGLFRDSEEILNNALSYLRSGSNP